MAQLVLVRHGKTRYNEEGLWTGWDNPPISENGKKEAEETASALKDIQFNVAFTSDQIRSQQTVEIILRVLNLNIPTVSSQSLRERSYGEYTKHNKWDVKKKLGDEEFLKLRRGWDYPIAQGETLKQVYERVVPYYEQTILPYLTRGENVLICGSGNCLRALIKHIENISNDDISKVEFETGEARRYNL